MLLGRKRRLVKLKTEHTPYIYKNVDNPLVVVIPAIIQMNIPACDWPSYLQMIHRADQVILV